MKKLPTKIYLRKSELEDHSTQERMVSCDEPFDTCVVEYTNLDNLWHDVSEEPKGLPFKILYEDEQGFVWRTSNLSISELHKDGWKGFVEFECITRWAYIDDLKPKRR